MTNNNPASPHSNGGQLGNNWTLNHVGMTVENRNATLRHYQSLGVGVSVGPQPLLPHEDGEGSLMFYQTLEGDPVTNTYQTGGAHNFADGESQIGDCQLECYPMRPGPGMFLGDYLQQKGAGINHICFNTPTVEKDTELLVGKGCEVMFNAMVNGKIVENYLDSRRCGDLMLSLRPPPSDWEKAWKANNEAHPLVNDWTFLGVGIGVSSLAKSIDYYQSLGFPNRRDITIDHDFKRRSQAVEVGPIIFEFSEPLDDSGSCAEALQSRGEGVFELIFEVADLVAEASRLQPRGLLTYPGETSQRALCFDTRAEGNTLIRLVQR